MSENRYQFSKIYKIQFEDGHLYIGSTTQQLSKRFSDHKERSKIKYYKHMKLYSHAEQVGWDNANIILVSEHTLQNKEQLLREEDKIIQQYFNNLLCLNAYRANIEVPKVELQKVETRLSDVQIKNKMYYERNKEEIAKKAKNKV